MPQWPRCFARVRSFKRSYTLSAGSMAKAIGQPYHETHPHLMAPNHITPGISREEFARRRMQFASCTPFNSIAIIPAYRIRYSSLNIFYPWQQNNNLLFLCGFDEPNAALVMEKSSEGTCTWTLFIEGNDEHSLLWSGPRSDATTVKGHFGLDRALPFKNIKEWLFSSETSNRQLHADVDENNSCFDEETRDYLLSHAVCLKGTLDTMRLTKSSEEQQVMRMAGKVGAESFMETIRLSTGTRREADLAAKMEFECRLRGASGLAYVPVVAGGDRANIIHYVRNDRIIKDDELVLMDAGAKVYGYCSDITRTFPISGKFTAAQGELYGAVLRVQKRCINVMSKWTKLPSPPSLNTLNFAAVKLFVDELGALGFRNPERAVVNLFPHSIGHYIGLDLHDCQSISCDEPVREGMIITIEPGIYVPPHDDYPSKYHRIGIRIEDDILISHDGCQNLTEAVPKEVEELEQLINSH